MKAHPATLLWLALAVALHLGVVSWFQRAAPPLHSLSTRGEQPIDLAEELPASPADAARPAPPSAAPAPTSGDVQSAGFTAPAARKRAAPVPARPLDAWSVARGSDLRLSIDFARLRSHPAGASIQAWLRRSEAFRRIYEASRLDPWIDFDRVVVTASGADPLEAGVLLAHYGATRYKVRYAASRLAVPGVRLASIPARETLLLAPASARPESLRLPPDFQLPDLGPGVALELSLKGQAVPQPGLRALVLTLQLGEDAQAQLLVRAKLHGAADAAGFRTSWGELPLLAETSPEVLGDRAKAKLPLRDDADLAALLQALLPER